MPENEQIFCYDCVYGKDNEGRMQCRKYEIQVNPFSSCGAGEKAENKKQN